MRIYIYTYIFNQMLVISGTCFNSKKMKISSSSTMKLMTGNRLDLTRIFTHKCLRILIRIILSNKKGPYLILILSLGGNK